MKIFIPYNKKYISQTYGFDVNHISFIENVVLKNLLKRLVKDKLVTCIDIYTQEKNIIDGIQSTKLHFIKSVSNELETSEEIIKDYISISNITEPFVYYNLMFPFTEIAKLNDALNYVKSGKYESATGVIIKGVVWTYESHSELNPLTSTPKQDEINTGLDVGSFCIIKPQNILDGFIRTTPPVKLISLASHELINMRTNVDKDLYQLVLSSGMPL